jgi:hypothetical protein
VNSIAATDYFTQPHPSRRSRVAMSPAAAADGNSPGPKNKQSSTTAITPASSDTESGHSLNGFGAMSQKSRASRLRSYMSQDVHEDWADVILIVLSFISGMVDSAVFNTWSCFVSMQTGNTVYVGLGVSGQPYSQPYRWIKSLTAISSFCFGSFVFSRFSRIFGPLKRSTMVGSMGVQVALCLVAFGLVVSGVVPKDAGDRLPHDFIVLAPLSLLSFQSAGQIVISRFLGYVRPKSRFCSRYNADKYTERAAHGSSNLYILRPLHGSQAVQHAHRPRRQSEA